MSWIAEFGSEWMVPQRICKMVASGEMSDDSWHNDAMPMFGVPGVEGNSAILAVDHVDPEQREYGSQRFFVSIDEHVFYNGDSVADAIKVWRAARWLFHGAARRPPLVRCGAQLCEHANVPFDIAVASAGDHAFCGMREADGDWIVRVPSGATVRESFEVDGRDYVVVPGR